MLRLHTNLSTIAVDCCYAIHDKLTASRPCLSLSKILAILIYTIPYILMSLAYFRSGDDSKWISSYLFSLRCTPSSQCSSNPSRGVVFNLSKPTFGKNLHAHHLSVIFMNGASELKFCVPCQFQFNVCLTWNMFHVSLECGIYGYFKVVCSAAVIKTESFLTYIVLPCCFPFLLWNNPSPPNGSF
jgi:hypothetical protein